MPVSTLVWQETSSAWRAAQEASQLKVFPIPSLHFITVSVVVLSAGTLTNKVPDTFLKWCFLTDDTSTCLIFHSAPWKANHKYICINKTWQRRWFVDLWSLPPSRSIRRIISHEKLAFLFFSCAVITRETDTLRSLCLFAEVLKTFSSLPRCLSTVRGHAVWKRPRVVRSSGLGVAFLLRCCDLLCFRTDRKNFLAFGLTQTLVLIIRSLFAFYMIYLLRALKSTQDQKLLKSSSWKQMVLKIFLGKIFKTISVAKLRM